jgi:hypothetical protein
MLTHRLIFTALAFLVTGSRSARSWALRRAFT